MYREIKQQGNEVAQLKTQFASFKAVVNQRLSEYEKSAQFISDQYEVFNAEKEYMNMNIDVILGRTRDLEERLRRAEEQIDEMEQYSRRNCLVFMGINESRDKNADDLIMETCNTNLGVDLVVEDIERSRGVGPNSLQDVTADGNSLGKRLKSRPIIVKFLSYRKRHEVFCAKKN